MGNCKSKKSTKALRISSERERNSRSNMNKDQEMHGTKGTSKKVVPFTKGEMTSFGFKKKISSQLPAPVTLVNGDLCREDRRTNKSSQRNLSEGYQSGSSIESLCHASFKSTPKTMRKREALGCRPPQKREKERNPYDEAGPDFGSDLVRPVESWAPVNRFGFRQYTPIKGVGSNERSAKNNSVPGGRRTFFTCREPEDLGPQHIFSNKSDFFSTEPRSGGTQNAFRPCSKTPESNPAESGLRNSKSFLPLGTQPKRFTLQTSHLPKPQFAVKVTDAKTVKTATNYYRRGGGGGVAANVDSGLQSANSALSKSIGKLDTSPGMGVRRRLSTCKGKKLEMKVVGNKFELLKESEENNGNVVTEISLIKLPPISSLRGGTAVISTGLVEERTSQYLKKISQSYVSPSEIGKKVSPGSTTVAYHTGSREWGRRDEGLGTESEEEKLFKDSKGSEKFLTTPSFVEADEVMSHGEAMAEEDGWTTERPEIASSRKKESFFGTACEVPNEDPNFEFGFPNGGSVQQPKEEDFSFPSDSILEPLSSESESLDDKAESKDNDQEKNHYLEKLDKDLEDLGICIKDGTDLNEICERDTDIEDELDANPVDGEDNRRPNNCLGTPTPTSNSISLSDSDGRDFLIDDEIADQPQLCFSEQFIDTTYKDEEKSEFCPGTRLDVSIADHREKKETENGDETSASTGTNREEIGPNSAEGSLSPCDSIASDDLMLDFETSSFEECAGRSNTKCFTKATVVGARNDDSQSKSASSQLSRSRADGAKLSKEQTGSGRNTPATAKVSRTVSSPLRPFRCRQSADGDSVEIDKMTYELVFQDVVGMKAMLMNLKCLLSESDVRMEEEAKTRSADGDPENELADLRRQVLFLQQQLEEREKTVRILQLKVNETADCVFGGEPTGSRNAATQTGLDKFQQEFQRFGIFQATPVV